MDFSALVAGIRAVHEHAQHEAIRAVNAGLTLRNWAIGMYVCEYELRGEDRATYGQGLVSALADRLADAGIPNCDRTRLYAYQKLYRTYPQIVRALSEQLRKLLPPPSKEIVRTAPGQLQTSADTILSNLSYSHLERLAVIGEPLKRAFYEVECIRGQWSVRELRRQISSLYYERSGLSRDKQALARHVETMVEPGHPSLVLRDPYVFEFLGLRPQETMLESDLETALLNKLQEFLLELGRGFCFEARQKTIRIGGENYFVDLVFYHRILKCHVLVELKVADFSHENLGQLNTYVNWYREHQMADGDMPPIGILLCTGKNDSLVQYALAGMDNQLFVSRYQVALPERHEIEAFIENEIDGRFDLDTTNP